MNAHLRQRQATAPVSTGKKVSAPSATRRVNPASSPSAGATTEEAGTLPANRLLSRHTPQRQAVLRTPSKPNHNKEQERANNIRLSSAPNAATERIRNRRNLPAAGTRSTSLPNLFNQTPVHKPSRITRSQDPQGRPSSIAQERAHIHRILPAASHHHNVTPMRSRGREETAETAIMLPPASAPGAAGSETILVCRRGRSLAGQESAADVAADRSLNLGTATHRSCVTWGVLRRIYFRRTASVFTSSSEFLPHPHGSL